MRATNTLPKLREGLMLVLGPRKSDGSLEFLLHDFPNLKSHQLSWVWFELLRCWAGVSPDQLLEEVRTRGWVQPSQFDLASLISFLADNHLLASQDKLEGPL